MVVNTVLLVVIKSTAIYANVTLDTLEDFVKKVN